MDHEDKHITRQQYREKQQEAHKVRLNFWNIWSDRPYIAVAIVVIAILCIMTETWAGLIALVVLTCAGIIIIGHSHHPNRTLSIGFKLKASKKLSMIKAIQLGASILMFLATYMRKVVNVNFNATGTQDSLQLVQGLLSNTGKYGQQSSYILGLLNTLTGGSFWGSYRYATSSAQMMNDTSGLLIISWILLLMIAPAICVLSEFFKEPYSRNASLIGSILSTISLFFTPIVMKKLVIQYAIDNQMPANMAESAFSIGSMAYVAMGCSLIVLVMAIYRVLKKDYVN